MSEKEISASPPLNGAEGAAVILVLRLFDIDDLGAEVSQQHTAEGPDTTRSDREHECRRVRHLVTP